jgi:hypothetical protein
MDGAPVPITGEEEVVSLGLARRMRPKDGRWRTQDMPAAAAA